MYGFHTTFMGYACEWSPFEDNKLAIATAQHFGVVGNGKQHIIQVDTNNIIQQTKMVSKYSSNMQNVIKPLPCKELAVFNTREGIFDNAWSELNENQLLSACGDGILRLWDLKSNNNPLRAFIGHNAEIYAVDWNIIEKRTFLSGSWDMSIKLWDPMRPLCLATFNGHKAVIYDVVWCPHDSNTFGSCSEDHHLLLWDTRKNSSVLSVNAHQHEILSCDFSKYDRNLIATASCDRTIALWDLRRISQPLTILDGHKYAVRRIKFSPHHPSILMSVSYDMSVKLWDYLQMPNPLIAHYTHHTEFVIGCSFNLFIPSMIATAAWDEKCMVGIYDSGANMNINNIGMMNTAVNVTGVQNRNVNISVDGKTMQSP